MRSIAAPLASRRDAPLREPLRRALPVVVGVAVIAALGLLALRVGQANLAGASRERLNSRIETVHALSGNLSDDLDPSAMLALVERSGLSPDQPERFDEILAQLAATSGGRSSVVLLDVDGDRLAALPITAEVVSHHFGASWAEAVDGQPSMTEVFETGGLASYAHLVPVGTTPWAVVAFVQPALGSLSQGFLERIGSLSAGPGGLMVVDREGVALWAWTADLVGTAHVTTAELAALPDRGVSSWTIEHDGVEHTLAGTRLSDGYALVFDQASHLLYGDLRAAQRSRSLVLLGVLGSAVLGLLLFQRRREIAAHADQARMRGLLRNSHDLAVVIDAGGRLGFVSPAVEGLLGHHPSDLEGRPLADLCPPDDLERIATLLHAPGTGSLLNVRLLGASGTTEWFDVESRHVPSDGLLQGVLLTFHAAGERKALEDELVRQATHDRLTGLLNRATLTQRVQRRLDAGDGRAFALLYIDLDNFKEINDTHGHDAGDEVLTVVAARLRDVAGAGGEAGRLGGDEFVVVVDGASDDDTTDLVDEVLRATRAPIVLGTALVHVDASIGMVVHTAGSGVTVEQLVRQADDAMYAAKAAGRGRAVLASGTVPPPVSPIDDPGTGPATTPGRAASPTPVQLPAGLGRRRGWRRRLASWGPLIVAIAIVGGIGLIGHLQTQEGQRRTEETRIDRFSRFAVWSAEFYSAQYDTDAVAQIAAGAPWTFDGGPADQLAVEAFATTDAAGDGASAVLLSLDGEALAAHPADLTTAVAVDSWYWRQARQGTSIHIPLVADRDEPRSYFLLPIQRDGDVAGVLAYGFSVLRGPGHVALVQGGVDAQRDGAGGWSLLDASGRIYMSWSNDLRGRHVADRDELAGIAPGTVADLSDDETVLLVTPMATTTDRTYLAYMVPVDELFADLRVGTRARDLSFLAVVAAAVVGLAWMNQRREGMIRRDEERLATLMQSSHDVITVVDESMAAHAVTPGYAPLLGYPADQPPPSLDDLVHPDDRRRCATMLTDASANGSTDISDIRVRAADGTWRWFDIHVADAREHHQIRGFLVTSHDVTERQRLQEALTELASHDPLTGLPNRLVLASALAAVAADDDVGFAVLFVDLDHFKPVNDTFGHDAGDLVLQEIARRFESNVRRHDRGRGLDLVCRLGGDEFAVLLRGADEARARRTADRLIALAAEPVAIGEHTVQVGASIGVALSHPAQGDPDLAVRRADAAMYDAKNRRRGSYELVTTPPR